MNRRNAHPTLHTRREAFGRLGSAAAALAFPAVVRSSALGRNAPSERIALAMIGVGRQGRGVNLRTLLPMEHVRVLAVCDVDRWRLENARRQVDAHYGRADCRACTDWREVIARDDIDAVMVSTPDHWHVPISLAAVRAGKHVSCEKPLTRSIAEGRILADAARAAGVTFRTDSECRSHAYMRKTAELARNGYLGQIRRIEVGVPAGDRPGGRPGPMPVPPELDYDMWLGPVPVRPYSVDGVHPPKSYGRPGWMRCRDTCEGMITNWGTHVLDVAQLVNDTEHTGPVRVEATGRYPAPGSGLWNVLLDFRAQMRYANGVVLDYHTDPGGAFLRVEGTDGWIQANWHRRGGLQADSKALLLTKLKDSDRRFPARGDKEDFIHGIRTGQPTMADAEVGHRTCSIGQIAHIAIQVGRSLRWDPAAERFVGDQAANRLLSCPYRKPWGVAPRETPRNEPRKAKAARRRPQPAR